MNTSANNPGSIDFDKLYDAIAKVRAMMPKVMIDAVVINSFTPGILRIEKEGKLYFLINKSTWKEIEFFVTTEHLIVKEERIHGNYIPAFAGVPIVEDDEFAKNILPQYYSSTHIANY